MPIAIRIVFVLLLWMSSAAAAQAQQTSIPALDSLLRAEVDRRNVSGGVIQVTVDGRVLHRAAYGDAQRYAFGMEPLEHPDPMTTAHLFDLASLTKVLATTFAVMLLVDEGQIDLDAPVARYLPEFSGGLKERVTVRHLLTHTSGLPQWEPIYYHAASPREAYRYVVERPLEFDVGTARHYSDLGFMMLGYLVERVTRRPLDRYLRDRLYRPLRLYDTTFRPLENAFASKEIAATSHGNPFERRMVYDDDFGYECDEDPASWDGWRQYTLRGEVNDGNAFYAHGGIAGHAGLFSTVDDVQVLLDLLLHRGRHDGRQVISEEVVDAFLTADETGNGLGWAMDPAIISAEGAPPGSFGHTGFTGTSVVVMPELNATIILLTNRQHVGPAADGHYYDLGPTRQQVVDIVLGTAAGR